MTDSRAGSRGPSRIPAAPRRVIAIVIGLAVLLIVALALILSGGGDEQAPATSAPDPLAAFSAPVTQRLEQMAPQALVDQVLLAGFDGADASSPFLDQVRIHQLGGVLVDARNWTDSITGTALVSALRAAGREGDRIPPLLVADQEGGRYRAFADLPPEQTQLELGDAGKLGATEDWARETSAALLTAGFDLNLFPVADVATIDSPLADRAFSDDPATVADLTAAALRGCREAGLACAPLHFPGLGAASQDTDRGPATVSLDPTALADRDLPAFEAAFAEHVPAVVLSLAFYAAYDPVTPGALAEPVVTGLLRDELGFDGVAITDDLGSGAVRSDYSVAEAAVAALAAGADMVQIDSPDDQGKVSEAVLAALDSGELPEARLDEAAARVLELKHKLGLLAPQ
jgi:beta-N-acetylhexosaminidase